MIGSLRPHFLIMTRFNNVTTVDSFSSSDASQCSKRCVVLRLAKVVLLLASSINLCWPAEPCETPSVPANVLGCSHTMRSGSLSDLAGGETGTGNRDGQPAVGAQQWGPIACLGASLDAAPGVCSSQSRRSCLQALQCTTRGMTRLLPSVSHNSTWAWLSAARIW